MSIQEICDLIDGFRDKSTGKGASPREIMEAEASLAVMFPASYKQFLERYGWVRIEYDEFYGVGESAPVHLNLLTNTIAERTVMGPPMPNSLVPFLGDGFGNHYCLDTEKMIAGECPVVFWDHDLGASQQTRCEANSFAAWMAEYLAAK